MAGDERVRYCSECQLHVYNLSALSVSAIEKLVLSHEGRLCGRFYRRLDGTVLTRDCPWGFRRVVKRISRIAGVFLSAAMSMNVVRAQTLSPKGTPSLVQIEKKGEVTLVVTDQTGAVVPKASVSLVNEQGRKRLDGNTDSLGRLRFSDLSSGSYVLTVGWPGFETEHRIIALSQGHAVNIEVTMKVAALMGEVVVFESAAVELPPPPESSTWELERIDSVSPSVKPAPHMNIFKKLFSSLSNRQ